MADTPSTSSWATASAPARNKHKPSLNSAHLWNLDGGATGDEVLGIVRELTKAKQHKQQQTIERKRMRAEKQAADKADLLSRGAEVVATLRCASDIARLTVAQLRATIAFRAISG
eukprot:6173990-Pleurochrysis_carterae.AAC.1